MKQQLPPDEAPTDDKKQSQPARENAAVGETIQVHEPSDTETSEQSEAPSSKQKTIVRHINVAEELNDIAKLSIVGTTNQGTISATCEQTEPLTAHNTPAKQTIPDIAASAASDSSTEPQSAESPVNHLAETISSVESNRESGGLYSTPPTYPFAPTHTNDLAPEHDDASKSQEISQNENTPQQESSPSIQLQSPANIATGNTIDCSVFIVCKNAEATISKCLASLVRFAEIIVVDSGSTDTTLTRVNVHLSAGMPIRIAHRSWQGYSKQKQIALNMCTQKWCLNLDSDEYLDQELVEQIAQIVTSEPVSGVDAYSFRRREWLCGYGFVPAIVRAHFQTRLALRERARYDPDTIIHEKMQVSGRTIKIKRGWIWHLDQPNIDQQLDKQARYTNLKANDQIASGKKHRAIRLLLSPTWAFFRLYVLERHIVCGWAGFIRCVMGAQYSFVTEMRRFHASRGK